MSQKENPSVVEKEVEVVDLEPITIGDVTEVTGASEVEGEGDFNIVWGT